MTAPAAAPAESTQALVAPTEVPDDFGSQWAAAAQALGDGDGDGEGDGGQTETPAAQAEPTDPAKPAKPPAPVEPPESDGEVAPAERVKFREWKRQQREALAKERAKVEQDLQRQIADVRAEAARLQNARAFQTAIESGDFDAAAKAAGYQDWKTMQQEALRAFQSPAYKRTKELERKLQEREQAEAAEREQRQQTEQQAQQEAARKQYAEKLGSELQTSDDTTVAMLAKDDPMFVQAVMYEQQQAWDGYETISAKEAADIAVGKLRARYEQLSKIFGGQPASQAETPSRGGPNPAKPGDRTQRPPKSVNRSQATEVAPPKEMTDVEWQRHFAKALRESSPA